MCMLTSTSTAWNASKCTGQYECKPKRALGGIRNSWTAEGLASRAACKSDLQFIQDNYIHQFQFANDKHVRTEYELCQLTYFPIWGHA